MSAGTLERHAGTAIAGALEPRDVPDVQGDASNELDGRLCRGRDDDLVRLRSDAAMLGEMARQCFLQHRAIVRAAASRQRVARSPAQASRPEVVRELSAIGQARRKRAGGALMSERPTRLPDAT